MISRLARAVGGGGGKATAYSANIWGARGSVACGASEFQRYGGDTVCVELKNGSTCLVFDAGTGIRALGQQLVAESKASGEPIDLDIVLSHTHYDHVAGLPFFAPLFDPEAQIRIWLGREAGGLTARRTLERLFQPPLFPLTLENLSARISYRDFEPGIDIALPNGMMLATHPLNHPDGATGYRIRCGGKELCYITDVEHYADHLDEELGAFVEGADLMFYDAAYTDEEYQSRVGWGHSTWQEGLRLAQEAKVGRFVAMHHDPGHDDEAMARIERDMKAADKSAIMARQGMNVKL